MHIKNTLGRASEFLGLKKNIVTLLLITLLIYTGERLWERFLPKYLESIGTTVLLIAGLGFLQNMLGAFWALQGGYLSDRLGTRKSFLVFNLLAIFGYVIAIVFTNWIAVFIGLIFFSAWSYISLPASVAIIANTLGSSKTVMGISMHSLVRRIPMAAGPVLGGVLIMNYGVIDGIRIAFAISILLCLVGIVFLSRFQDSPAMPYRKIHPVQLWKSMDNRLKNLLVSDILVRFCEQMPYVFVVLWCMDELHVTATRFGLLTAIEMTVAALVYIPVAGFADKLERKPFVAITFIFFTIFPLMLYFSKSFLMLVAAFIIRGLKEFGEPTRKALIADFCPQHSKARTFGLYYFIRDFTVAFAAFAGGWLWKQSPELNLFASAAFGAAGTVYFVLFGKEAKT